jgi:predicted permease
MMRDLRHALRLLRRTPGFTAAAIVSLTLGIGANVAIVTLLDAVVLKPLPVDGAGELMALYEEAPKGTPDTDGGTGQLLVFSYPRFTRLQNALGSHGVLAATTRSTRLIVRTQRDPQVAVEQGQLVSGKYFAVLGARIVAGRPLTDDDARVERRTPVAVVSEAFANRALGGIAPAVGARLIVNNLPITVVGVAAPAFAGAWTDTAADLWLPLSLQQGLGYRTNVSSYAGADRELPWSGQDSIAWLTLIARVQQRELSQARAILQATDQQGIQELAATDDDPRTRDEMLRHRLAIEPLSRGFSGLRQRYGDALVVLAAMVGLVLLLTCANLATLLLTRANMRVREIAVRAALGATRAALFRQCLIESALLAAAGGIAGLVSGQWVSHVLASEVLNTPQESLPPVFAIDGRMLSFAALVTAATVLLFGVFPAWRATRANMRILPSAGRGALPMSAIRSMRPLVSAQLALSFVLVTAAGLFGQTLVGFARIDRGFNPEGVVEVTLDPVLSGYAREQMPALRQRVLDAVRAVPGVSAAAFSFCSLGANCTSRFLLPGSAAGDGPRIQLHNAWVGPGYFDALRIPRVSGREFSESDTSGGRRVAVISESVARLYPPGENVLGKHLRYQNLDVEIVGVVGDVRGENLRQAPAPTVYMPMEQPPTFTVAASSLDVRIAGDTNRAMFAIQAAVARAEPGVFVARISTLDRWVGRALLREHLIAYLSWAFAALALLLACVGVYGVLSYSVTGRAREIGIRTALGASPRVLIRTVLRDAAHLVVPGLIVGGIAVRFTGQLVDRLLFGVSALDPTTFVMVTGVLAVVSTAAALVPARRAARIDPVRAMQTE